MRRTVLAAVIGVFAPIASTAGPIDSACIQSSRAANPMLCACIQRVANLTLSGADQRLAAKFFRDPGKAQEVRQSASTHHRDFWARYTSFGQAAEQACAQ